MIYTTASLFRMEPKATVKHSDLERFDAVQQGVWGVGVEESTDHPLLAPRFAKHLLRVDLEKEMRHHQTGATVHQCAPLRFILPEESVHRLGGGITDAELRKLCWASFAPRMAELVMANEDLIMLQKGEIQAWVESHTASSAHVRRYQGTSNQNMYRHMVRAHRKRMAVEKDRISDGVFLTFCVVFDGFQGMTEDDTAGTVYVSIYTQAKGHIRVIPLPSRIAPHDGKTHFIKGEEVEVGADADADANADAKAEEEAVGIAHYGFTHDIEWSPIALETQLDFFIRMAQIGIGYVGQRFTGIHGRKGIPLSVEAYGGDTLPLFRQALRRIEQAHGVRIRYMRRKVRTATEVFLNWIEWM